MFVLGINSMYHESAACLLRDGELIAMAEEERFNRVKHAKKPRLDNPDQLPIRSIRYCLAQAGIDMDQVDCVGYSSDPAWIDDSPVRDDDMVQFVQGVKNAPARFAALGFKGEFHWVNHHTAHAASAYYASPFEDAAVLTVDGIGDGNSDNPSLRKRSDTRRGCVRQRAESYDQLWPDARAANRCDASKQQLSAFCRSGAHGADHSRHSSHLQCDWPEHGLRCPSSGR